MTDATPAILGIDPGNEDAAWALVSVGYNPRPLAWARLRNNRDVAMGPVVRGVLGYGAQLVLAVIEDQFVRVNPRSATQLAHQAGAWAEACRDQGVRAVFVPPSQWQGPELAGPKLGKKLSTKDKALNRCRFVWGLTDLSEHEADALLIARYAAIEQMRRPW
jgi:Holliday junction resolvasome RuvABC endonuclease subunit